MTGDTVVVGAYLEDSSTNGVNSTPDEGAGNSGAAYIFSGFGPPDISLEAPTGTAVSNGTGTAAFGQVEPGQSMDITCTLRNTGGSDLTGITPTITGTDATMFSLFTSLPSTLAGGGSASFTVRFSPNSPGARSATLSIASNDADENPFTLALSGTGNTPPVFSGYSVSTAYQTAVTLSPGKLLAAASDADGHALSVTAAGPASAQGGTAVIGSGILYTPPAAFSGTDTFPVTITDAFGATVNGTVTVTVGAPPGSGGSTLNPPQVTVQPNGKPKIAFQGIPGRAYRVERTTNFSTWPLSPTSPPAPPAKSNTPMRTRRRAVRSTGSRGKS